VTSETLEIEGTWEEVMAHAPELVGRRVRLTVLPDQTKAAGGAPLPPPNQRVLQLLEEWEREPLTEEEQAVLDGLEEHLRVHPFSLRSVEEDP
jgi:hypothetical protein